MDTKILKWLNQNQVKTNKGSSLEFDQHAFMLDILCDDFNKICIRKCSQVGASTIAMLKTLYYGQQEPLTIIYTLPAMTDAKNFVLTKFDPTIERSQGLRDAVQKIELRRQTLFNSEVKRIGPSYYMFKGSFSKGGAQSIDADIIVIDELDFQNQEVKSMWEERTMGSSSKNIIYWVGYPSIPNFGMEQIYEDSDQRNWFIECNGCHKRQTLTWPDSIDMERQCYICKHCHKELTDQERSVGLWKPTKPENKEIHGYYINRLMAPWIPAARIIHSFKHDTPNKFYNYTLGLPYVSKVSDITDEVIEKAMLNPQEYAKIRESTEGEIVIGIDQGDTFHMVIAYVTPDSAVVIGGKAMQGEDDIIKEILSWNPSMVVMDMNPNRYTAKKIVEQVGSDRVFMGNERLLTTSLEKSKTFFKIDMAKNEVKIDRTDSLDNMMNAIIDGHIVFKSDIQDLYTRDKTDPGIIDMLRNMVPKTQIKMGVSRRVWVPTGPDHYGHALNFMNVAIRILYPDFGGLPSNINSESYSVLDEIEDPWYIKEYKELTNSVSFQDDVFIVSKKGSRKISNDKILIPRNIN